MLRLSIGCSNVKQFSGVYPEIVSFFPSNNSVDTPPFIKVSIFFNKAMDPASFGSNRFTLSSSEGLVPGTVTFESGDTIVRFVPSSELSYGETYLASLSSAVKDTENIELGAPLTIQFTVTNNIINEPYISGAISNLAYGTLWVKLRTGPLDVSSEWVSDPISYHVNILTGETSHSYVIPTENLSSGNYCIFATLYAGKWDFSGEGPPSIGDKFGEYSDGGFQAPQAVQYNGSSLTDLDFALGKSVDAQFILWLLEHAAK